MSARIATNTGEWREVTGFHDGRRRNEFRSFIETRPALLYYGDSWFSTPLYPNLARQSAERIDGASLLWGTPGGLAQRMLSDRSLERLVRWLEGHPFDALVVSLGGNDALSDHLEALFASNQGQERTWTPAEAFAFVREQGLMTRIRERYEALLLAILDDPDLRQRSLKVVGHTYSHLVRIGDAGALTLANIGIVAILIDDVGPWLYGPMRDVLADESAAAEFARLLLEDGFKGEVLEPLAEQYPDIFSFADLLSVYGLDDPGLWYDEIHPGETGFKRLAGALNAEIRGAMPAHKQHAVW